MTYDTTRLHQTIKLLLNLSYLTQRDFEKYQAKRPYKLAETTQNVTTQGRNNQNVIDQYSVYDKYYIFLKRI